MKRKFPIAWHEECLVNFKVNLASLEAQLARMLDTVAIAKGRVQFLTAQIEEAKRRGLTEFDGERLLVRRGGNVPWPS